MGRSSGDDDGEGEHTRFPCLASLRSLVAAVVTALAIVVVVMVIVVLHRPEKIILTSYGYVQTQDLWWRPIEVRGRPYYDFDPFFHSGPKVDFSIGTGGGRGEPQQAAVLARGATRSDNVDGSHTPDPGGGGGGRGEPHQAAVPARDERVTPDPDGEITTTEPAPAKRVTILLILFAYNPSGRGKVDCNVTSITVVDATVFYTTPFFANMTEIKTVVFPSEKPLAFSVPPQSWHRDRRSVQINDTKVLSYLYDMHIHQTRFRVMTQVNVTYKPLHSDNKWINVSYYCWPVFFVYGTPETPGGEVTCKTGDEMDYAVSLEPPPTLAPAPAPAPPGPASPGLAA